MKKESTTYRGGSSSKSSSCCGCPNYYDWKAKFNELNIDDATKKEAYNVSAVISLKKGLEKYKETISQEVKEAFSL